MVSENTFIQTAAFMKECGKIIKRKVTMLSFILMIILYIKVSLKILIKKVLENKLIQVFFLNK